MYSAGTPHRSPLSLGHVPGRYDPGHGSRHVYSRFTSATSAWSTLVDVGMVVKARYSNVRPHSQPFRERLARPDIQVVYRLRNIGIALALKESKRLANRPYDSALASLS